MLMGPSDQLMSPTASPVLMLREGDVTGDDARDEVEFRRRQAFDPMAAGDAAPPEVRAALLAQVEGHLRWTTAGSPCCRRSTWPGDYSSAVRRIMSKRRQTHVTAEMRVHPQPLPQFGPQAGAVARGLDPVDQAGQHRRLRQPPRREAGGRRRDGRSLANPLALSFHARGYAARRAEVFFFAKG